jgi:hypothetical protein
MNSSIHTKFFKLNLINVCTTCDTKYHKQHNAITSIHLPKAAWVSFYFQRATDANVFDLLITLLGMGEGYYCNTIANSPPGEQIFIFLEKIRFASQKLNFSIFGF